MKHKLKTRLKSLGNLVYNLLRKHVLQSTGLSPQPWQSMLKGADPNIHIAAELCDILDVTPKQLLDPSTPFDKQTVLSRLAAHEESNS